MPSNFALLIDESINFSKENPLQSYRSVTCEYADEFKMFRRLIGKPTPELDIDLYPGYLSPGTRIWDRRSGPVVDSSGPMQDSPLGA